MANMPSDGTSGSKGKLEPLMNSLDWQDGVNGDTELANSLSIGKMMADQIDAKEL
jgi:hypothetical protein